MNVKKLRATAKLPYRATPDAAGLDLYFDMKPEELANGDRVSIRPHETYKCGTGIAVEIPKGYFGAVVARSGMAVNRSLRPINSPGIVDEGYRGEIIVALHNDCDDCEQVVLNGERVAQLIIMPYLQTDVVEVDSLSETERGDGGFGHTGTK